MQYKFKVGDKVRVCKINNDSSTSKKRHLGETFTIREIYDDNPDYPYSVRESCIFCWNDDELELVTEHATNEKIVITVEGNTTLARLYKDGKVVKSAEAKCSPEDTFDFKVGANLAYNRLMGVPTGEEKKEAPKPVSKFKSGDKVVVRKNTCWHPLRGGDVIILKKIWEGMRLEKRVMWKYEIELPTGLTMPGPGYIVEDDIELYDTLKLTKEDIKKMKDGKKVWCSVINHPVFGKEEEQFDDGDYCMWYTIRHLSPTSIVLVGEDGDYWDIDDIGIEFNAYLTEQKR